MESEYAPQYTFKERLRHLTIFLPLGIAGYALCQWWLFPKLHVFAEHAACETVFGVRGPSILLYGVFVFIPLFFTLATAGAFLPTAVRTIKTRRYPPPGKKVYRPVKIKTGRRAVASSLAHLIPTLAFAGFAVWGYGQASQFLERVYATHPNGWQECAASISVTPAQSGVKHD